MNASLFRGFGLSGAALLCLLIGPAARAALPLPPAPDGGYVNQNTAEGDEALLNLTTGSNNTAIGFRALKGNLSGTQNTASGALALELNTGYNNTATGYAALELNTTGQNNTATGVGALQSNTNGLANTASGASALANSTTGENNTAAGTAALLGNTTGENNTASGANALQDNSTGSFNIGLGFLAGSRLTTGDNNIDIGNFNPNSFGTSDVAGEDNTIRIGHPDVQTNTYIAGINGITVSGANPVVIDASGHLGTTTAAALGGLTSGDLLFRRVPSTLPVGGFTRLGTTQQNIKNLLGKSITITLDVYQKN